MKFEISVGLVCVVSAMRMPHFQKSEFSPTCWNAMQNLMSTQSNQVKIKNGKNFVTTLNFYKFSFINLQFSGKYQLKEDSEAEFCKKLLANLAS